jgi:hypothetical protein
VQAIVTDMHLDEVPPTIIHSDLAAPNHEEHNEVLFYTIPTCTQTQPETDKVDLLSIKNELHDEEKDTSLLEESPRIALPLEFIQDEESMCQ